MLASRRPLNHAPSRCSTRYFTSLYDFRLLTSVLGQQIGGCVLETQPPDRGSHRNTLRDVAFAVLEQPIGIAPLVTLGAFLGTGGRRGSSGPSRCFHVCESRPFNARSSLEPFPTTLRTSSARGRQDADCGAAAPRAGVVLSVVNRDRLSTDTDTRGRTTDRRSVAAHRAAPRNTRSASLHRADFHRRCDAPLIAIDALIDSCVSFTPFRPHLHLESSVLADRSTAGARFRGAQETPRGPRVANRTQHPRSIAALSLSGGWMVPGILKGTGVSANTLADNHPGRSASR